MLTKRSFLGLVIVVSVLPWSNARAQCSNCSSGSWVRIQFLQGTSTVLDYCLCDPNWNDDWTISPLDAETFDSVRVTTSSASTDLPRITLSVGPTYPIGDVNFSLGPVFDASGSLTTKVGNNWGGLMTNRGDRLRIHFYGGINGALKGDVSVDTLVRLDVTKEIAGNVRAENGTDFYTHITGRNLLEGKFITVMHSSVREVSLVGDANPATTSPYALRPGAGIEIMNGDLGNLLTGGAVGPNGYVAPGGINGRVEVRDGHIKSITVTNGTIDSPLYYKQGFWYYPIRAKTGIDSIIADSFGEAFITPTPTASRPPSVRWATSKPARATAPPRSTRSPWANRPIPSPSP